MTNRLLISIILSLIVTTLLAQGGHISVESKVDKDRITIGDLIKYTVSVTRDKDLKVEMPGLGANLGAFEIRDYNVFDPQEIDGKIVEKVEYTISTFETGEFEIPPLTIRYAVPGDTTRREIKTEKIKIFVESLKPSEAGDIKDIKGPVDLKRDLRGLIYILSAAVAAVLIGLFVFYYIKKRKSGEGLIPKKIEPPRPAHEVAYEELEKLKNSDLLERGLIKEFYIELSDIIRRYIEGRYFITAMELTTTELIEKLQTANLDQFDIDLIGEFLDLCDLVKFAKYIPSDEENGKALEQAYQIVDRTKIQLVEVQEHV